MIGACLDTLRSSIEHMQYKAIDSGLVQRMLSTTEMWSKRDQIRNALNRGFLLFGAGYLGQRTIAKLRTAGIKPYAVIDNYRSGFVEEIEIFNLELAIEQFGIDLPVVITIWQGGNSKFRVNEVKNQLHVAGISEVFSVIDLYWSYPEILCPYLICDEPDKTLESRDQIVAAFNLFEEDYSQKLFLNRVKFRINGDFDLLVRSRGEEYFEFLNFIKGDVCMLDIGAYTGDTLIEAASSGFSFSKVLAIEPDPRNFEELEARIASIQLPITVVPMRKAIGNRVGKAIFSANSDMTSRLEDYSPGTFEVDITTVDEVCETLDWTPNFIKVDVEGAERLLLEGSSKTIRTRRPMFAIALEHNFDDLWSIPLFFASLASEYSFFLRHYSEQGFDVVLYAVPSELLK